MLKCYNLSEADLTAVCSFQSILTRTGAVYRGLNSPHPNPSAENKLHIYRRIKRWNGTFPTTHWPKYDRHKKWRQHDSCGQKESYGGTKGAVNVTVLLKMSRGLLVLCEENYCDQAKGVYWRAGGVLAAFCFLSKLHRVGANFVKYWCSVYLTGKKENRCQGIICKKNATCGRYSGPRLQDFSASYQIFSLISKGILRKALQAQFNAVAKSAASSANFSIKIWFLDTQNTSYLIVRDLKNAFSCP